MKLTTKRLILRDIEIKDAEDIAENGNDYDIGRYTAVIPYPYTLKDAKWWINKCLKDIKEKPRKNYNLGIALKSNNKIIGAISLDNIDMLNKRATIGYWLGKKYREQGIMSEAEEAILKLAFDKLKLNKLKGEAVISNKGSNSLFRRFGFRKIGIEKEELIKKEGKLDAYIYELLREDWRK